MITINSSLFFRSPLYDAFIYSYRLPHSEPFWICFVQHLANAGVTRKDTARPTQISKALVASRSLDSRKYALCGPRHGSINVFDCPAHGKASTVQIKTYFLWQRDSRLNQQILQKWSLPSCLPKLVLLQSLLQTGYPTQINHQDDQKRVKQSLRKIVPIFNARTVLKS
jgi:hypothetical protein